MKVLFLSQIVPYPPHGGVLQRGYYLLRELSRHAEVHLFAFVHPDILPDQARVEESRQALQAFCTHIEYFRLWAKTSPAHRAAAVARSLASPAPFSVVAHRSRAFTDSVGRALGAGDFGLVHVDTLALAPFVSARRNVPAVLTHHNIESQLMSRRAAVETNALARRFLERETVKLKAAEAAAAPTFDVNIVVSAQDEATLCDQIPGVATAVVPNGVATDYFRPTNVPEKPALVYTGGMNMFANRDAVMYFVEHVWPLIVARRPDVKFFAVGQDPPAALAAFADRDRRIVTTGYVDDIRPIVQEAAVYVVPLRVGGGTRLKVLDAMSSGKALVSTTIGCEGIEAVPGKHLVIADTPGEFAEATLSLLDDSARRRELGRAARDLVESRYAWPVIGEKLLAAYAQASRAAVMQ